MIKKIIHLLITFIWIYQSLLNSETNQTLSAKGSNRIFNTSCFKALKTGFGNTKKESRLKLREFLDGSKISGTRGWNCMVMFLGINFISLSNCCVESTDKTSLSTMHYLPQKSYRILYRIPLYKEIRGIIRGILHNIMHII